MLNWPPERICVMDLAMDGFSATQRTFMEDDESHEQVRAKNGASEAAMLLASTDIESEGETRDLTSID